MKKLLSDYSVDGLKEICLRFSQPSFRAKQLFKWLSLGADFEEMTDLPKAFKAELSAEFSALPLTVREKLTSKDGSAKYLYELGDGNFIEGVFMPHDYGNTLCVSTQVGCRMGCAFCASGIGGLVRNLTPGEMLGQVVTVNREQGGSVQRRSITNLVLMGSGEPLDNYENVTAFLRAVSSPEGMNIGLRNISLSTCGLPDGIRRLADEGPGVTLSLSLHATTDESRRILMPVAKRYPLSEVLSAVRYYFEKTGRRVIFEYSMVKDVNMNFFDAKRLSEMTKGFAAHVNLIMLNYVKEKDVKGCTRQEAERFLEKLTKLGVSATIRKSFGSDIGGACGQLRNQFVRRNVAAHGCPKD